MIAKDGLQQRNAQPPAPQQAQVMQQQQVHLIEVLIDILNPYLKVYILKL